MQDNNSIPTQTFSEEMPLDSTYANYDSEVSQAENLLKQVGNAGSEPAIYNPGNSNNFLFGKSVAQIFIIAAVLISVIIGVAVAGVLRAGPGKGSSGDGRAVLASAGNSNKKDEQQQIINNSTLEINRSTVVNKNFVANGDVLVQSNQDSNKAFKIQSSSGNNILVADTAGRKITVGDQPPGTVSLAVNGDITTNGALVSTGGYSLSSEGLKFGNLLVCSASGCISSSSPPPSPTFPTIDVANLVFRNTNNNFSGINKFTSAGNVFAGDGSGLSALNAGNISSGTLSDTRLSNNVAQKNANNTFSGSNTFNAQIQAAAGVNSVTGYSINGVAGGSFTCGASQLLQQAVVSGGIITSGTCVTVAGGSTPTLQDVYDASAPANVVLSNASGVFSIQDAASPLATNLFEVGSNGNSTLYFAVNNLGISVTGNVNTTGQYQVGGVQISSASLSNDANLAKLNANQTFSGNNTFSSASNSFTGNGSGLTNVNAAQLNGQAGSYYTNATNISTGTLSDSRLSNNVALLNALQTFTGQNTFSNASNSFTGNGSNLTGLNASNASSGTLNDLRLSPNVTLAGNTFNGASQLVQLTAGGILPVLNGSNLTSLNASNITSGTLGDSRLSSNVALLDADNIFLGDNSFHLNSTALTVQDAVSPLAGNLFEVTDNTGTTKYFEVSSAGVKINGDDVCTTAGNCVGTGSGGAIGGSGTAGKLAKFTGTGFTIGDSLLSESGSVVAVNGSINIATGNTYQINGSQISSAALSNDSNLAKLNGTQTFSGSNTFSNASNSFTGNGSGLTSLNASNVSSGTLNDARLSSNVALKNADNTFTGNNVFNLNTAGLAVQDAASPLGTNLFEVTDNAGTTKYFTVSTTALQFNGNDVCTTAGNCVGTGGSGAVGGSGTAGKIAKFTGSGFTVGDSLISDNGSTVTVGGTLAVNTISPTATLTIGVATQALALQGNGSTSISATASGIKNSLVFATPTLSNKTITLPDATGTVAVSASGPLSLDAAGNLTCPSCLTTNGSGGGSGVSSVNTLTGSITLAGTANQVIITPSANTLTFSLPQDISASSTPDFAGINIGGSAISSSNLSDSSNLAKLDGTQTFTGANTFSNASNSFTGDGSGLTNLNASNVSSGTLNDARLSSNVPLKNAVNTFTNTNIFQATNTAAFQVQSSSAAETLLTIDSTARSVSGGNIVKIGNSTGTDGNTTILVLDSASANPSSNLSALNGGLFYNSTTNKIEIIENGAVKEVCNKTDLGCGSAGVATTLAGAYANGASTSDSVLSLDTTRGGVIVKDNSSPIGGTLFGVQNSTGSTKYFDLSATGITVAGNVDITGTYKVNGSQIASSNLSDSTNLAKLNANQTFTNTNTLQVNSLTAFQIQNATTPDNLFVADTNNHRIAVGQATANYTLDVAGDVNSTTGFRVGGNAGSGLTCSGGNVISNAVVTGGIITGGSCVANGAGVAPTLQNVYDNSSSPATITTSSSAKTVLLKAGAGSDANNLFTVQNAAGGSVLQVDSVNRYIGINNSSPNAALDINASSIGFTNGFEGGALSPFTTTFSGTGTGASVTNAAPHNGNYSAVLGNWSGLGAGQNDLLLTKTLSSAGTVSYWCKGAIGASGDHNSFLIDGVTQNTDGCFSGSWVQFSFAVGSGSHNFDWRLSNGFWDPTMWVDDVQVTNAAGTPTAAIINGGNVGVGTSAPNATLDVAGTFHLQAATNSASLFQIQNASAADTLLTVDSSARSATGGNLIKVGNNTGSDVDTTILVVDSAAAVPTTNLAALNGGLFYNSTTNHLNVIENGAVKEVCNKSDLGCGSAATPTLAQVYGYGASTADSVLSLDTTRGGVVVKDNATPIGGTLFGVQSNTGTKYLDVTSAGISVTNVSVAAGGYISIAGGNTASRPASPTEGMLYYDTTTKSLLVYSNGKWQADRSSSTKIVAMGTATGCTGSSPVSSFNADAADYVVTSCTSAQTTINAAITALGAQGGTVYLAEGTYIIDGQINMASNVTLAGSGPGTILKLKDGINAAINTVVSSSVSRVTFRDLKLDGNRTNNTSGTQNGLYMSTVGSGSGTSAVPGYTVDNVTVQNFRSAGIYLNGSANSSITRNNIINNGGEGIHAQWPTSNVFLTINGNTVQGNSSYGIYSDISAISYSTISNNTLISNSNDGIYMNGSNNSIDSNTIYSNSGKGIELQNGNNTVTGNNVSSNTNDGIYTHGTNNTISGNTAVSNSGFGIDTDNVSSNNSVSGNKVSGNASGGINLGGSTNQASANTVISNTNIGIKVVGSNNTVSGNTVSSNTTTGIYVNCCSSNNNIVSGNQVSSNSGTGITIDASNGNQISNNRVYDNGGSGSSSSILVFANAFNTPDKNIIKDNIITDTAGTGYAIELSGGLKPTNTYISNNAFSGTGATAILDTGTTGTTYINQSKSTTSDYLYRFGSDSATAFQVQNAGGSESLFSIDTTARSASGGNLIKIGNSTGTDTATTILVLDGATAAPTSNLGALNGGLFYNSTTNHVNVIENGVVKELCNKTDLGCGSASTPTLSQVYGYGASSADSTISLDSTRGGITIKDNSTPISGSLFSIQDNSSNKYLDISSSKITVGENTVANAAATATTATTSGTGTNTTTVALTAVNSLANGDVIFIDNAGQDYFTRITAGGGTASLTVDPAVTYETGRTVTKYNVQYLGSDGTNFTGATRNQNSFYQGYFLGGVVTGAGSTVYSDANISSVGNLRINTVTGVNIQGTNSSNAFQVQDARGNVMVNLDTSLNVIKDSLIASAPYGTLRNSATWVSGQYVQLNTGTSTNGELEYDQTVDANYFDAAFQLKGNTGGADATWFYIYNTSSPVSNGSASGGYAVAFDEWNPDIELSFNGAVLATKSSPPAISDGNWHNAEIKKNGTNIKVYLDNVLVINYTDVTRTLTGTKLGLGGWSGGVSNIHRVRNFTVMSGSGQMNYGTSGDLLTVSSAAQFNDNVTIQAPLQVSSASGQQVLYVDSTSLQVMNSTGQQAFSVSTSTNSVSIAQGNLTVSGLSSPQPPALTSSATGGTLAAATYYYELAAVNANGTTPAVASNPVSVTTTGATSQNTLTWSPVTNASSYKVYRSTDGTTWKVNTISSGTTSIVDNGTNYSWGTAGSIPTANTSGGNLSVKGSATFANTTNSTNALDVQDATGDSILRVDSADRFIGINSATPVATLDVAASPPAPDFNFGFEDGTVGAFTNSSALTVNSSNPHSGTYAWGGDCSGAGSLYLTRTLSSAGTISFWAWLDQEFGGDGMFFIDGVNMLTPSQGTHPYAFYSYPVSAGTHTFQWYLRWSCGGYFLDDVTVGVNSSNPTAAVFHGGNVGIGTTAPNATLETDGTAIFKAVSNVTSTVQIQNAAGDSLFNADTANTQITIGRFVDSTIGSPASPGAAAGSNQGGTLSGAAGTTYYYKVSAMTPDGESPLSSEVSINGASFTALTAPGALTVGAPSAGGSVTVGTHSYKVTFVTANGETTGGTTSSQVNVTTGGTQTVPLTAIPTGPTGTTSRKIYRTVAGDTGNYLLLTTIANNTTTTFNDTIADASLGAAAPVSNTATTNTNNATISWSAVTGATSYRVYRATASGAETSYQASASSPFTDTGAAGTSIVNTSLAVKGIESIQNFIDTASAFQVQNAAGNSLFNVDTSNNAITLLANTAGQLGTWTTNATPLPALLSATATVVANGYVYEIGGTNNDSGGYFSSVYYAKINGDGSIGSWTTSPNSLPNVRGMATSVYANGFIYVIGGWQGACCGAQTTVYYTKVNSDGSIGKWTTGATPLPVKLYYATSVYANGYIYEIGGNDGTSSYATVYYAKANADGTIGPWQTNANPLPAVRYGAASVVANGYVYVTGGYSGNTTVYYAKLNADGSTGSWTTASGQPLPIGLNFHTMVLSNGYMYAIGGGTSGSNTTVYYTKVNKDGTIGSWQLNPNLFSSNVKYFGGVVTYNGYIYNLGGNSGFFGTSQSTIYYATTPRVQIGGNLDLVGLQNSTGADPGDTSAGSLGGSITAGNITAVGTLQVQGAANFAQSMSVNGNLAVAGQSISLGSSNSGELGTWTDNSNALPAQRYGVNSVVLNGYVYVIAGRDASSNNMSTIYYAKLNADGSVGSWQTNAANPLPVLLVGHQSFAANGYVYVVGGTNQLSVAQSNIYYAKQKPDGSLGAWTTSSNPLPAPRWSPMVSVANGYVYVAGGRDNSSVINTTVYYAKLNADGSTGPWQTSANVLPAAVWDASSIVANGYTYVIGGANTSAGTPITTVYYAALNADGSTGAWQTNSSNPLPAGRLDHASVSADGYVYVIGGYDGTNADSTIYYAKLNSNGSTGTWSTNSTSLPAVRRNVASIAVNGYIYEFGGRDTGGTVRSNVYYASTTRIQIGGNLDLIGMGGQNLADAGATGGNVTAADITAVGSLQVQGAAGFAQGMSVGGNLTVNGTSIVLGNSGELSSWTTSSNPLPANRRAPASVTANGYAYVIGGYDGAAFKNTVYYAKLNADGTTSSWSTSANNLPQNIDLMTAVVVNNYVYVIGGNNNGTYLNTVYYAKLSADGSISAWSTSTNTLPANLYDLTSTTANGYIYVLGGNNGIAAQAAVYYAKVNPDGSIASWTTSANPLPAGDEYASAVVANGYLYELGGSNHVYYAKLNLDGSTGAWTSASMNVQNNFGAVISNGYIYEIGGWSGTGKTVYYAKLNSDGSFGSWVTAASTLPIQLDQFGIVTANGYIYAMGGESAGVSQLAVYYASTARVQIGANLDLVGLQSQTLADGGNYSTGSGGGSITAGNGTFVGALQVQGSANFAQGLTVAGNFSVNNILYADSTNLTVTLGQASSTPVLLVLGNKNTSGDPTCVNGAMYYNSNSNAFRFCQNGSWVGIGSSTPSYVTSLPGSPSNGQEIYYNVGSGVTWHLRYNSTNSNWEYLGGGASFVSVGSTSSTSGSGAWESKGTQYTFPLAGQYMVKLMGRSGGNSSGTTSYIGVGVGTQTVVVTLPWNDGTNGMNEGYVTSASAGTALTLYHQDGDSTRRITASNVSIEIIPLTVN